MANRTVDELLDLVPALRERTAVNELAGGLTNTNYKVDTPHGRVCRAGFGQGRQHARHRPRKRVPQLGRGSRGGVGAGVIDYLPDESLLVLEFITGETQIG